MSLSDDLTYHAEEQAFQGTPLGDRFTCASLIAETLELAAHPAILPYVGPVRVRDSVRLTSAGARANPGTGEIVFSASERRRYVPLHELSHLAHKRWQPVSPSHGPGYRGTYAALAGIAYGETYRRLLLEAFHEVGAEVTPVMLPVPPSPAIDIDRLADTCRGVRWL